MTRTTNVDTTHLPLARSFIVPTPFPKKKAELTQRDVDDVTLGSPAVSQEISVRKTNYENEVIRPVVFRPRLSAGLALTHQ
jgi:hypothetical protein